MISIDDAGRLRVTPSENPNKIFRFVYRAALEVDWDEQLKDFFTPIPKEWSYADWFSQIRSAVKSEMGIHLRVVSATVWKNISDDQRQEIENESGLQNT